jgi:ABC-type phosphate transport system substrate-binding protein
LGGVGWANRVVQDQAKAFGRDDEHASVTVAAWKDEQNVEQFIAGKLGCEVLFHRALPSGAEQKALTARWPHAGKQPEVFLVGQVRIAVAVNRGNPVKHVTLTQIRDLLRIDGHGKQWREVGGGAGAIKPYGEGQFAVSRVVMRSACMMVGPSRPRASYAYREEYEECPDGDGVLERLRTDRNGIGFFLYSGQEIPPHVKLLAVAKSADSEPVALEIAPVIQKDYPLAELLVLYLRPDASPESKAFCEFAMSPAGAAIARSHGVTTALDDAEAAAEKRLALARAGRGTTVHAAGPKTLRPLMPDLATEYVRAHDVIQVPYAASESDIAAIGNFVSDRANRPELLFLAGRPSDRALELHGERWKEVNASEHLLAGRATAIIVNAANKLDALPRDAVEAIFSGETEDWAVVDGTSLVEPQRRPPGTKPTITIPIHRFGVRQNDPAAIVFQQGRPPRAKNGRLTQLPDTAAVVAAVGTDPYAIGFADFASIRESGQTVKILGIAVAGDGAGPITVRPSAATIRDESYPFAERLYVYAHPDASDTAMAFAGFLAGMTAGAPQPDADGRQVVERALRAHGLLRLATPP